jgi:hypothetical protein
MDLGLGECSVSIAIAYPGRHALARELAVGVADDGMWPVIRSVFTDGNDEPAMTCF